MPQLPFSSALSIIAYIYNMQW